MANKLLDRIEVHHILIIAFSFFLSEATVAQGSMGRFIWFLAASICGVALAIEIFTYWITKTRFLSKLVPKVRREALRKGVCPRTAQRLALGVMFLLLVDALPIRVLQTGVRDDGVTTILSWLQIVFGNLLVASFAYHTHLQRRRERSFKTASKKVDEITRRIRAL